MFSDRYVVACGVNGIQYHARYSDKPVYAYRLSFKGKYSVVQLLGQNAQDWGTIAVIIHFLALSKYL